ncbi:polar amino acid transport system substrate-binding protein [Actinoplanes campanulatus]|uniref:Polar amino acid transport system substrate-binding protein n=1 Tax=Actinoplanes campanulatus TaxID=113559 RepID=A0A7W5AET8_9ACTN|nr:glutamate ABC transporter substrate-binding protein [Actinoplanes campanulatus]MBB3094908.1 polar amino acid transport system substrate-binding protein [Actinoplanes campanulatus]GGN08280.1 ABC transporter substrate-binding protein [Actinoplanes campanulatus]GID36202.1 ABC transporter substrate-binding protein [Actinoplanes campanulatus]
MRALAVVAALTLLAAGCTPAPPPPAAAPGPSPTPSATGSAAPVPTCEPRKSWRPTRGLEIPAGSRMAEIRARGHLILGTSQDTLLFSSRDPFTGAIEGFDVDMAREISRAIFGSPDKVRILVIPRSRRVDAVATGQVDMAINTMTTNCARWQRVAFSTVYYEAGQKVLVGRDSTVTRIQDLGGRPVCAASGSTSLENLAKVDPRPVAVARRDFGECLVAFQQNEVEAISTDDTILAGLAAQDPYAKVVGLPFTQEPYAIAISQTHRDLTEFVNAVLERMRADGTWKALYDKWLHDSGPAPKPPVAEYQ